MPSCRSTGDRREPGHLLNLVMMLPVLVPCLAACEASSESPFDAHVTLVLESPDTFAILALEPLHVDLSQAEGETFHGYRVLGQAELTSAAERQQLLEAVYRGIHKSKGLAAACFNPRHGIHAVRAQDTVDLVICFECLQIHIYPPSGEREAAGAAEGPEGRLTTLYEAHGLSIHHGPSGGSR